MAKKTKAEKQEAEVKEETAEETAETPETAEAAEAAPKEENPFETKYNEEHDSFLRLAAEYDNFRKRTI